MIKQSERTKPLYFPYAPNHVGEAQNYGSIVAHPERADDIPEAQGFPELAEFLREMNSHASPYMTLGCGWWPESNPPIGYVEFSFRSPGIANDTEFICHLDDAFLEWLEGRIQGTAQPVRQALHWEFDQFSYFGTEPRNKLCCHMAVANQQAAGQILDLLREFLMSEGQP